MNVKDLPKWLQDNDIDSVSICNSPDGRAIKITAFQDRRCYARDVSLMELERAVIGPDKVIEREFQTIADVFKKDRTTRTGPIS